MSLPNTQPLREFLTLAPATSSSYPRVQASTQASEPAVNADAAPRPAARRSSSVSSSGGGFKVLKLGPVHWGEHQDDHKEDFHEISPSA